MAEVYGVRSAITSAVSLMAFPDMSMSSCEARRDGEIDRPSM